MNHVTRPLKILFFDYYLYATFALALLAVTLAYQLRVPFSVDVGGQIDGPLLSRVHDPQFDKVTGTHYRWTMGDSALHLRDWGAGNPAELRVRVTRWQPPNNIADLTLYVNGLEFAEPTASGQGWQEYVLPITEPKFLASDDLSIKFETDTFIPKETIPDSQDPRQLGIQLDSIRLFPLQNENDKWRAVNGLTWAPFKLPPLDLALYFIGSALVLYAGLVGFKIPRAGVMIIVGLAVAAGACALVWARPYATIFADAFFATLIASVGVGLIARVILPRLFMWGGVHASVQDINWLALIFVLAFWVRLDFLLYPQTISFDLTYHVHRLQWVLNGNLFWSHDTPKDFLGVPAPYPPSLYLFLLPFAQLVPLELLIKISGALLDSITIFFLYYLLKKYFDGRAGLFAAWIYSAVPLGLISLSWGIYANIWGQFLTLLLVVTLVEGFDRLVTRRGFVLVTLLLLLTFLSHGGILTSLAPFLAVWIGLLLMFGRMWRARSLWILLGSIVVASMLAFAVYYSEFLDSVMSSAAQLFSDSVETNAPVVKQSLSWWRMFQPARTEYIAVDWYIYLSALLGLTGLIYLVYRAPTRGRFLFVTMMVAWLATLLLFVILRVTLGFSPRYVNFVMPALAICAGVAWGWLFARGRVGRVLSLGLALVLAIQWLYHWYVLAMFKYH